MLDGAHPGNLPACGTECAFYIAFKTHETKYRFFGRAHRSGWEWLAGYLEDYRHRLIYLQPLSLAYTVFEGKYI